MKTVEEAARELETNADEYNEGAREVESYFWCRDVMVTAAIVLCCVGGVVLLLVLILK